MKSAALIIAMCASFPAFAVGTSYWTHTSETDFAGGTLEDVVVTNRGELKLSRGIEDILSSDPKVATVHALAEGADGTVFAATGMQGAVMAIKDGKSKLVADFGEGVSVTALLVEKDGSLLAATSGDQGRVHRIKLDQKKDELSRTKHEEIFAHADVQYIWSLIRDENETLFIATGPQGQLFSVDAGGKLKLVLDTTQNNLLSLASDGKGTLYVGSDPHGITYKVSTKTGEAFVVYDASEPEINALLLDAKGNLYLAASAGAAAFGELAAAAAGDAGQPENPSTAPSPGIHDEPPAHQKPSDPPAVSPDDAPAIPRTSEPKHLMILEDPADESITTAPAESPENPAAPSTPAPMDDSSSAAGSAVYRVDPEGFVREIFREQVTLYAMIESDGKLFAATGSKGVVYSIDQVAEEITAIAHTDATEITALLKAKDGAIYLGTSSGGSIAKLSPGFAKEGVYTSAVLDATQISRFGKLQLNGTLPKGSSLKIATRSGNLAAEDEAGWSPWTDGVIATQYSPVTSPSARFLQYRLTFVAGGDATPSVSQVKIAYQQPNQAPTIKSLIAVAKVSEAALAGSSEQSSVVIVAWEADDLNTDRLQHALSMRTGTAGPWVKLKDKLTEATYEWDTRSVADGSYQLKVETSDASANPIGEGKAASRVSDTVIVDNTPPQVGDLKTTPEANEVTIELRAVDQTTTVASLEYSVDSSTDWQSVPPLDKIADSPDEAYRFSVPDLAAGAHQITLRAVDLRGNAGYQNVSVNIAK